MTDMTWIDEEHDWEKYPATVANTDVAFSFRPEDLVEDIRRAEFKLKYEPSQEKFVEYEYKDLDWAEYFGFVKRKKVPQRLYMSMGTYRELVDSQRQVMPFTGPTPSIGGRYLSYYGLPVMIDNTLNYSEVIVEYDTGNKEPLVTFETQQLKVQRRVDEVFWGHLDQQVYGERKLDRFYFGRYR